MDSCWAISIEIFIECFFGSIYLITKKNVLFRFSVLISFDGKHYKFEIMFKHKIHFRFIERSKWETERHRQKLFVLVIVSFIWWIYHLHNKKKKTKKKKIIDLLYKICLASIRINRRKMRKTHRFQHNKINAKSKRKWSEVMIKLLDDKRVYDLWHNTREHVKALKVPFSLTFNVIQMEYVKCLFLSPSLKPKTILSKYAKNHQCENFLFLPILFYSLHFICFLCCFFFVKPKEGNVSKHFNWFFFSSILCSLAISRHLRTEAANDND